MVHFRLIFLYDARLGPIVMYIQWFIFNQFHPLKVYIPMGFDKFVKTCNYHQVTSTTPSRCTFPLIFSLSIELHRYLFQKSIDHMCMDPLLDCYYVPLIYILYISPYLNAILSWLLLFSLILLWPPWTVAHQAPSVHRISQARILEQVVIFFSRRSSWPRDQIWVSCIGRRVLYHWATRRKPLSVIVFSWVLREKSGPPTLLLFFRIVWLV